MTGSHTDGPLFLRRSRKLMAGATLLACSALVNLFPEAGSRLFGVNPWVVELSGAMAFFALLYWLAHGFKCPGCGVNLFWHSLGHAK